MFGLTAREQRWKAEQKAVETLVALAATVVEQKARIRIAELELEKARALQAAAEAQASWNEDSNG